MREIPESDMFLDGMGGLMYTWNMWSACFYKSGRERAANNNLKRTSRVKVNEKREKTAVTETER